MEATDWNSEYRELAEISNWGGPNQRIMMQAIYLIAFTCLLRFDEVLKIQHHHIEIVDDFNGHIRLTLPFRKTHQYGEIKPSLSSDVFLESFRRNLVEIGRNPLPYGTHSFRRGGCQYLASVVGWPLQKICDWGGWSTNFKNATIVRYLINWNDDPTQSRDDFWKPASLRVNRCAACGQKI